MAVFAVLGEIVRPPRYKDSGNSRNQAVKNDIKKPLLCTEGENSQYEQGLKKACKY